MTINSNLNIYYLFPLSITDATELNRKLVPRMEATHVMEVGRLLLSLLHSWGLDLDLDEVCETQLGLLRPKVPLCYGVLSKGGYMSLMLPTWQETIEIPEQMKAMEPRLPSVPENDTRLAMLTRLFTARLHWELSTTLTSNHLLAMVSMSNTLMSMNMASFLPESERNKKFVRQMSRANASWTSDENQEEMYTQQQAQIKQGWSLLSTHHCFLLPDKIDALEPRNFKRPQVEIMARRWQHHCIEIREAAQQILLGELGRMGKKGRKQLVENWAQFLPLYTTSEPIIQQTPVSTPGAANTALPPIPNPEQAEEEFEEEEEEVIRKPSSLAELKRKQACAVILLGVIGAEFGQDISAEGAAAAAGGNATNRDAVARRKSSVVEGFGIGNNNLARLTSMALTHLLLAPPTAKLPAYTPLRRAAIDLIGRGFIVWEPYLDVSKVLLGLLEICCDSSRLIPNLNYKLPLTSQADACRTARHALRLIATAR